MPYPKGELFDHIPEELGVHSPEILFSQNSGDLLRVVQVLEANGIIGDDYGETSGLVGKIDQRVQIAIARREAVTEGDPSRFERSSLTGTTWDIKTLLPDLNIDFYGGVVDDLRDICFVQFRPKETEYTRSELITGYYTSQFGIQIFPSSKPLEELWSERHPDDPFLAVRSFNEKGKPEEPYIIGLLFFAQKFGITAINFLSKENLSVILQDEQLLVERGNITTNPKTGEPQRSKVDITDLKRKRVGSVPIVRFVPNGKVTPDMVDEGYLIYDGISYHSAKEGDCYSLQLVRSGNITNNALLQAIQYTLSSNGQSIAVPLHVNDPSHRTQYDPHTYLTLDQEEVLKRKVDSQKDKGTYDAQAVADTERRWIQDNAQRELRRSALLDKHYKSQYPKQKMRRPKTD